MSGDVCPADRQSLKTTSAVSNGKPLFGDGRSVGSRRFRDLMRGFGDEVGGFDNLRATGQQVVRRLSQISVELELLDSQRAAGGAIDPVAYCTLVNSQRRLLADLAALARQQKLSKAKPAALHDYLATRTAAVPAAPKGPSEAK